MAVNKQTNELTRKRQCRNLSCSALTSEEKMKKTVQHHRFVFESRLTRQAAALPTEPGLTCFSLELYSKVERQTALLQIRTFVPFPAICTVHLEHSRNGRFSAPCTTGKADQQQAGLLTCEQRQ
jgi:hypothetical protein